MEKYEVISLGDIPMSAFDCSEESSDTIEHFECFGDVPIDILMHHGIKGQRWGIRRYQNKDGSLTKAGKKRYAKLEAELEQLKGGKDVASSSKPKRAKDMTDDELRDNIARMKLEDEYNNYYSKLNPKKQKTGHKYLETFMSKAVLGISEGTQGLLRDALVEKGKEALGLKKNDEKKPKTEYEKLKEEYDRRKIKYDMAKLKKDMANLDKDDANVDISKLIRELSQLPEEERNAIKTAASVQENLNKLNKASNK